MEDENKKIFGKVSSLLTRDPKLFIPWSKEVEGILRTAGEARNADFLSGPTKGIRYAFPPITQQDYLLPPLPGMQWSNEQVSAGPNTAGGAGVLRCQASTKRRGRQQNAHHSVMSASASPPQRGVVESAGVAHV